MALHTILLIIMPLAASYLRAQELSWPYNLPPHIKYYPEDEVLLRRDIQIAERVKHQLPIYVKKMTGNPNEKFFLDYWCFAGDKNITSQWFNQTAELEFGLPLPFHADSTVVDTHASASKSRLPHWNVLDQRDFGCPTDTVACTSIDRPNTCCPNGSTCQIVPDNGLGDVGCCPASRVCAGSLSQCPQGYTSCPNNPGGGCCLPGYACYDVGCVKTSTTVVVVTTTSTTAFMTTPTPTPSPTTPPNVLVCSPGYRSCPISLGGGCCSTDRACGRDVCPEISSSASLSAPVRPTVTTTSSSVSVSGCPTGFYACSAYHQGGCCQVGRDCASTSCPTTTGQSVVNTNGVTAVAPSGTYLSGTTNRPSGTCANGWSTCVSDVGGGCCPTGYACGTIACSATAAGGGGSQVGKEAPRSAASETRSGTSLVLWFISICTATRFMLAV